MNVSVKSGEKGGRARLLKEPRVSTLSPFCRVGCSDFRQFTAVKTTACPRPYNQVLLQ